MKRFRVPSFNHPTCDVPLCAAHFYPWKLGPHSACELVIPVPGGLEGGVHRVLHLDGRRTAYVCVYDRRTREWIMHLPLPRNPRRAWRDAVRRARLWTRMTEGGLALPSLAATGGMALPHGSPESVDPTSPRGARRTRTRARVAA